MDPHKITGEGGLVGPLEWSLEAGTYIVGRDESADLTIQSNTVSRRHAQITVRDGGCFIQDLNSSNGTFVNDARLADEVRLQDGDVIRLGRSISLRYSAPPPAFDRTVLEFGVPDHGTVMEADLTMPDMGMPPDAATEADEEVETEVRTDRFEPPVQPTPDRFEPPAQPPAQPPVDAGQTMIAGDSDWQAFDYPVFLAVEVAGAETISHRLEADTITLGRADENDVVIPSKIVSRHHARVERRQDGDWIIPLRDVGNPLYLSGRPLNEPHRLHDGDKLRIGGQDPGLMVTITYLDSGADGSGAGGQNIDFAERTQIAIGRDPQNDITLNQPIVSRFHAHIERVGKRYRVRDLRSANGTFVNNKQIEGEVWLAPGDAVRIGRTRFVIDQDQLSQVDDGGLRVVASGLNKWVRKDLNILQDISLVCEPREFVVVVGQSGGGKSTLLDAISGYRPATHGRVMVNEIDVYANFDAIRNEIGYVPQRDIIHMELTTFQALDYAAQLRMPRDTTKAERHARIDEVLDDLDIAHRKNTQISSLSGGQIKRVSIGVELLTKPGLFFLDEPTSGLDPGTETLFMQLMRRLADQGRTIILVTHATKNVMLADKVVFLARGGYMAWYGPPNEALAYFDQYRTDRERRARNIEFDEIYAILEDQSRGTAEQWAERYKESTAYHKYVQKPLRDAPNVDPNAPAQPVPAEAAQPPAPARSGNRQVSSLRQLQILSARNLKILTRDRFSLLLMLLVAPIVSLLDVILALVLGRDPFSFSEGFMPNVLITLFLPTVYGVMVAGLSQMREIVKEQHIYRRERLVNLRLMPYIVSKVWVAALLALYQAAVYTLVHHLAFDMPGGLTEWLLFYFSLTLATMAGMMLGLFASALAPTSNAAPLIVIVLMLPQIVLGGALVPLPQAISAPTSTSWAFQAFMAITGVGSDVAADACWQAPENERALIMEDLAYKNANCRCMGTNVLEQASCDFPGSGQFITAAVNAEPPVEPTTPLPVEPEGPPQRPVEPEVPPQPAKCADESDSICVADYLRALEAWQEEVDAIRAGFDAEMAAFEAEVALYEAELAQYRQDLEAYQAEQVAFQQASAQYQANLAQAVVPAEGAIDLYNRDFGWLFVNGDDSGAYWGTLMQAWLAQGAIIAVLFVATVFLQKRKDQI